MLIEIFRGLNFELLFSNLNILILFLIFLICLVLFLLCIVITVDYYGYRKRFFSIVIYKRCFNLVKIEAKNRKISKKKVIEEIINNHYKNYDPDIAKQYFKSKSKKWDYSKKQERV